MKFQLKHIRKFIRQNKEDFEYLLFVGFPGGVIILLLYTCTRYSEIF